jgi:hypothetical protein
MARPATGNADVVDMSGAFVGSGWRGPGQPRRRRSAASPSTYFDLLALTQFRVTINIDNRLMSDTSISREMHQLNEITSSPGD